MATFEPTHEILLEDRTDGQRKAIAVKLIDGAAYTRAESEAGTAADWECSAAGEWTFQGAATPGPNWTVSVRPWTNRVSHTGTRRNRYRRTSNGARLLIAE